MYAWLCLRLPVKVVDWMYVVGRAAVIVAVVIYSDLQFGGFFYLRL